MVAEAAAEAAEEEEEEERWRRGAARREEADADEAQRALPKDDSDTERVVDATVTWKI